MDTNALKKFAQAARNLLIDQVTSKIDMVLAEGSPARREHTKAIKELESAIRKDGKRQVIEQVAYTWFNRFTALRFMDANGYTNTRIVSPADGATRPELLAEAMAGNLPEGAPPGIAALLDGRTPSSDPQAEAYRQLLVRTCNQWHGPMPFLFEQIDDYTELLMPEDLLSQTSILAELRKVMTEEACQDVEIIGWLYQFYISEKKDQVFAGLKKNQKITAENIPAATQLFTPHWIVRYLVENSLGRLWLLNRPQSRLAERMDYYIAPEEPETDFLRISRPEDIRICDPAAGSGHMLTYAFDLLYAIYEEEGYDAAEIPALILTHNLTGMEIDDRAGALAAFALAMKAAAKLGRRRFLRMEAKPDICVLQNVSFTDAEMQDVAAVVGKDLFTDALRETLGQFEQAKNFGSLIVPKLRDPAEALRVVEARDFGGDLLLKDVQARVVAVLRMAEALSPKYHVVVANPPYMGGKGMNAKLDAFAKESYPDSKSDLFAMFIERSAELSRRNGFISMITMQSWMFLSRHQKLREKVVATLPIRSMAHLGSGAFDSIGGEVVSTTAFVLCREGSREYEGSFIDLRDGRSEAAKFEQLRLAVTGEVAINHASSTTFEAVEGQPIAHWISDNFRSCFSNLDAIKDVFKPAVGLNTGDNDRFLKQWFEVGSEEICFDASSIKDAATRDEKWFPYNKGGGHRKWYGNQSHIINWQNDGQEVKDFATYRNKGKHWSRYIQNLDKMFLECATWSDISTSSFAARFSPKGFLFDVKGSSGVPHQPDNLSPVLSLLCSSLMPQFMRCVNPTSTFQVGDLARVPFAKPEAFADLAVQEVQTVQLAKSDWDAYETSWDFTTLPLHQPDHRADTLEGTYTTLRTHWQGMTDEMLTLEEENNRIFIDAYGLQDELTPDVPLNEITLTCNPAYRYGIKNDAAANEARLRADTMAEFLSYAVGCMFGRYSLDTPSLILANQGETLADYLARIPEPQFMPDEDNVIPVLDADWFPDDITDRFRLLLRTTFGEAHFRENLRYIEDALGKDIRKYFTRDFYTDHVKRYKKRPIYWMFSSPKGTFNALIYMHRYRADTVSVILNDYLREFISKLEAERGRLEKLSDDPSASQSQRTKALKDVAVVVKQIDELNEWEREVVFPLAQAKIEIDLDDGVKANYPKFGAALKKIVGVS
ncbi:BREX-1 system adenine-specific DNA-methyltransferase PglX [Antarctobacter heliothermus]|uniref:site-specific DNA-methyltransferase (adenine-specific) n=1 Tax=Antarctobacter heliothermus TaxID=74033 RepID=A0A239JIZ7_9RHOB|nr:BREX-1 system adenine-specific DNA-methyltransferase PglX [Antarctobacter heliothermus]SNT05996.1 Type II restriction/modification system, DNA methylase subunit YeeA [Antarctobacter heliothermus]